MEFYDFNNKIKDMVEEWLGDGYEVLLDSVRKNNNICLNGLSIRRHDSNICPIIYLEPFYNEMMNQGKKVMEIAKEILATYKKHEITGRFDMAQVMEYENVKSRLKLGLINTGLNQGFLSEVPHREFLDLSIIYKLVFDCGYEEEGSMTVKNEQLEAWGITEQELFEQACKNEKNAGDMMVTDIRELIGNDLSEDVSSSEEQQMYVAGTKNRLYGAVAMLDQDTMQKAEELVGGDFMILPSSIHELILIPSIENEKEIQNLSEMVKTVNCTQLKEQEILSDHVYRYHSKTGDITIAA